MKNQDIKDILTTLKITHAELMDIHNSGICKNNHIHSTHLTETINNIKLCEYQLENYLSGKNVNKLSETLANIQASHTQLMKLYNTGACENSHPQLVNLVDAINNLKLCEYQLEMTISKQNQKSDTAPEM